jgi:hypothetical protein
MPDARTSDGTVNSLHVMKHLHVHHSEGLELYPLNGRASIYPSFRDTELLLLSITIFLMQ